MEKVLGIIAEYNPLHNGHIYHIEQSKKVTNCKYTICIMSGNFTQRGSCSLVNKWCKTKMAIQNGIDLVIELPLLYSISSAENFAFGNIKLLDSLKIVDNICFGAECDNIELLTQIADILYHEPVEFQNSLLYNLHTGVSFPKAREIALLSYLNNDDKYSNLLSSPNNILGIEYIKSLKTLNSSIVPKAIKRISNNYNSTYFDGNIASSTAIRELIKNNKLDIVSKLLPENCYSILINSIKSGHIVNDISDFEKEIIFTLRKMPLQEISALPDVNEGLENALKKAINSCNTINDLFNMIKSKRYTTTRLQRILLYSLLGITKKDLLLSKNIAPYVRILGFNENGKFLLSKISNENPSLNLITSVKKFENNCNNNNLKLMLEKDILATNVYTLAYKCDSYANLDYTQPIQKM